MCNVDKDNGLVHEYNVYNKYTFRLSSIYRYNVYALVYTIYLLVHSYTFNETIFQCNLTLI